MASAMAGLASGCLYKEDERCPVGSVYNKMSFACVCPGGVPNDAGSCRVCGLNEEPKAGQCACKAGTSRNAQGVCDGPGAVDAGAEVGIEAGPEAGIEAGIEAGTDTGTGN